MRLAALLWYATLASLEHVLVERRHSNACGGMQRETWRGAQLGARQEARARRGTRRGGSPSFMM
jgi:hypothetical protein